GFDPPAIEVKLWIDGINKSEKKDKGDKKDEKKDEKKDKAKDKKEETKKEPKLKDAAKPNVTLLFGKVEGEYVYVKRIVRLFQEVKEEKKDEEKKDTEKKEPARKEELIVSRFTVPKKILDKLTPKEGTEWVLAFLDTSLPELRADEVTAFTLEREKEKSAGQREKMEKIEAVRHPLRELPEWTLNIKDYVGRDIGDNMRIELLLRQLSSLQAQKWLTKVDPKEDLDKFGLKTPAVTVTLTVKKVVTK